MSQKTKVPNAESPYGSMIGLAEDDSPEAREAVFTSVRDVLLDQSRELSVAEIGLGAEILRCLLSEMEVKLRWDLATRIAGQADVPAKLILDLANDEIEVASPVLTQSLLLTDSCLIEIIRTKAQAHQLAIARRESISADVSTALVETDHPEVIKELLENAGAEFSHSVLDFLVEESKWQTLYQRPLINRAEVPEELARRLYQWVAAPIRAEICSKFDIDPALIDRELELIEDEHLSELAERRWNPTKTQAIVQSMREKGELTGEFLVNSLLQGETGLFEDGLIELTGLNASVVSRIIHDSAGTVFVIICRAIDISLSDFQLIYKFTRHDGTRARTPSKSEARIIGNMYEAVSREDACCELRKMRRDPENLDGRIRQCAQSSQSGSAG